MLSINKIALLLFGLMLSNVAFSKSTLSGNNVIDLYEAISRTFEHNPELQTLDYRLRAQSERQGLAAMSASPELSFNIEDALGSGSYKGTDNAQVTLGIAWLLEGGIRQGFQDVALAETQSLRIEADLKKLDIASNTAYRFVSCLRNQARLKSAGESLDLARETALDIKKRLQAGRATEAEFLRTLAEVDRSELDYEDAEHELKSSYRLLAAQWGVAEPDFTEVKGDIFLLPSVISYEELQLKLHASPQIMRLNSERSVKQAELKLAQQNSSPAWQMNLGVRHYEASGDQSLVAGISIPFGERSRNRAGIAEARVNLAELTVKEDGQRVRFLTDLYVDYQEYLHSLHRIEKYKNNIIPALEKALLQTRKAYAMGRFSYLEWRAVQLDLLDARAELLQASVDAHLVIIELERLTGVRIVQPDTNF